jgi:hypothetical protein
MILLKRTYPISFLRGLFFKKINSNFKAQGSCEAILRLLTCFQMVMSNENRHTSQLLYLKNSFGYLCIAIENKRRPSQSRMGSR